MQAEERGEGGSEKGITGRSRVYCITHTHALVPTGASVYVWVYHSVPSLCRCVSTDTRNRQTALLLSLCLSCYSCLSCVPSDTRVCRCFAFCSRLSYLICFLSLLFSFPVPDSLSQGDRYILLASDSCLTVSLSPRHTDRRTSRCHSRCCCCCRC